MSKSGESEKQQLANASNVPTAPTAPNSMYHPNGLPQYAPPPSYEESQRMFFPSGPTQPYSPPQYYGMQTPQTQLPMGAYGYNYNYGGHQQNWGGMQQQPMAPPQVQNNYMLPGNGNVPVLHLAKGAEIRTTATGAVSIPPPPPGYAATPEQLAAMQGQSVLVKKQKNSFF